MTQSVHLLVDVGNSRIKWNYLASNEREFHHSTHSVEWNIDELPDLLDRHWEPLQEFVTQVSVSNVGGEKLQQFIAQWCLNHWNVEPRFAITTEQFGEIKNGYDNYQELGVDRWLTVIAAHQLYPASTNIIIDYGSATTVDTLLPTGEHRAGPILSENKILLDKLLSNAEISDSDTEAAEVPQVFVNNTKNAILNGAKFATSRATESVEAIVKQIVKQIESELAVLSEVRIVVTGGAAKNAPALSTLSTQQNYYYEPDLVLKGLAYYFEYYDTHQ